MPPADLGFSPYEALELDSSATQQDIVTSYRRLARVHHPDKNPENLDEATASFQRVSYKDLTSLPLRLLTEDSQIQAAHELLSNPTNRSRYDQNIANPNRYHAQAHHHYYESEEDEDYYDEEDDFLAELFASLRFRSGGGRRGGSHSGFFASGFSGGFRGGFGRSFDEQEAFFRESEKREEDLRKQQREEARQRNEAEFNIRKEREAAKKLEEDIKTQAKQKREIDEKINQERIWKEAGATTHAEKQKTCLHSEFWPRSQQKRKYKCSSCGQKRGPTAFRCPHCQLQVCTGCNVQLRQDLADAKMS